MAPELRHLFSPLRVGSLVSPNRNPRTNRRAQG